MHSTTFPKAPSPKVATISSKKNKNKLELHNYLKENEHINVDLKMCHYKSIITLNFSIRMHNFIGQESWKQLAKKLSLVLISFTIWNFLNTVFKFYRKEDMQKNKKAQKKTEQKEQWDFFSPPPLTYYSKQIFFWKVF